MALNKSRIWLGGVVGGVVWTLWSFLLGYKMTPLYVAAQNAGLFLKQPRYSMFVAEWIVTLFVLSILIAHLYAWVRATAGPGLMTAFKVGAITGFFAGFPLSFAQATWSPVPRTLPLGWTMEMWGGAILASIAAGYLYKE